MLYRVNDNDVRSRHEAHIEFLFAKTISAYRSYVRAGIDPLTY